MKQSVRWTTDIHAVRTIADDSFGGWEQAFVEAIKNSLDAKADRIDLTVPVKKTLVDGHEQVVVVEDNGDGMTLDTLRGSFCRFGRFKPQHRGTGKVAIFKVAHTVELATWCDGVRHELTFATKPLLRAQDGTEPETEVATTEIPDGAQGTKLILTVFSQDVTPPSEDHLHHVILRNFHHRPGIRFFVNGTEFKESEHATEVLSKHETIEGVGTAELHVLLAKSKGRLAQPGVVVYCEGQKIHGPDLLGLEAKGYRGDAERVTRRILGRLDLQPDDPSAIDSGAWTLSRQHGAVANWAGRHLEAVVDSETSEAIEGRVEKWLQDSPTKRYYDRLPADEKSTAKRILREQAKKTGVATSSAQTVINRLVCRSLQSDALAVVIDVLNDSPTEEVESFSELFKGKDRWTLRQVTRAASLVKHHLQAVDDLEKCVADYSKQEWEIHQILKENPWLIADDYHSFRSNRQIRTTLRKLFGIDTDDREALKRPDFFFTLGDAASSSLEQPGRYLFIELKGPNQPLEQDHQNQVVGDAKKFMRHQPGFAFCALIGTEMNPRTPPDPDADSKGVYTFKSFTFAKVIERARFRLEYIAQGVRESGAEELARLVLQSEVEMLVDTSPPRRKKKASLPEPVLRPGSAETPEQRD